MLEGGDISHHFLPPVDSGNFYKKAKKSNHKINFKIKKKELELRIKLRSDFLNFR